MSDRGSPGMSEGPDDRNLSNNDPRDHEEFSVGDKVKVLANAFDYHGQKGTIRAIDPVELAVELEVQLNNGVWDIFYPYELELDEG